MIPSRAKNVASLASWSRKAFLLPFPAKRNLLPSSMTSRSFPTVSPGLALRPARLPFRSQTRSILFSVWKTLLIMMKCRRLWCRLPSPGPE